MTVASTGVFDLLVEGRSYVRCTGTKKHRGRVISYRLHPNCLIVSVLKCTHEIYLPSDPFFHRLRNQRYYPPPLTDRDSQCFTHLINFITIDDIDNPGFKVTDYVVCRQCVSTSQVSHSPPSPLPLPK